MKSNFDKVSKDDFAPFKMVLGKMLRNFGEISSEEYDLVGQVQASTIVIADAYFDGDKSQRTKILDRFGGRDWNTKEPTGKLDLNGSMFNLKKDTAIDDLNEFLESIGIERIEDKMNSATNAVHEEKGVPEHAAAAAVIIKALCLNDYDKNAKQAIVDASLIMQMSLRALERIEGFEHGIYNREEAQALRNLSSKMNYKFDPSPLIRVNEELDYICNVEQRTASEILFAQQEEPGSNLDSIRELEIQKSRSLNGERVAHALRIFVNAMPAAAKLYEIANKPRLAEKALGAHSYYFNKYEGLLTLPQLMKIKPAQDDNNPELKM